jgi:general secretion pathway protein J
MTFSNAELLQAGRGRGTCDGDPPAAPRHRGFLRRRPTEGSRTAPTRRTAGFTLLELLVALAVFAVVAVLAYGGLRSVLDAREHADRQAQRLAELQSAVSVLGRDVEQVLERGIRNEFGDPEPPLRGGSGTLLLELTRAGWRNPAALPRSDLQRVAYRLDGTELVRLAWQVLDRAQDAAPLEMPLLTGVAAVEVRFFDHALEWRPEWPPPLPGEEAPALPRAVEITLELEDWGRVTRLLRLPG